MEWSHSNHCKVCMRTYMSHDENTQIFYIQTLSPDLLANPGGGHARGSRGHSPQLQPATTSDEHCSPPTTEAKTNLPAAAAPPTLVARPPPMATHLQDSQVCTYAVEYFTFDQRKLLYGSFQHMDHTYLSLFFSMIFPIPIIHTCMSSNPRLALLHCSEVYIYTLWAMF